MVVQRELIGERAAATMQSAGLPGSPAGPTGTFTPQHTTGHV